MIGFAASSFALKLGPPGRDFCGGEGEDMGERLGESGCSIGLSMTVSACGIWMGDSVRAAVLGLDEAVDFAAVLGGRPRGLAADFAGYFSVAATAVCFLVFGWLLECIAVAVAFFTL